MLLSKSGSDHEDQPQPQPQVYKIYVSVCVQHLLFGSLLYIHT